MLHHLIENLIRLGIVRRPRHTPVLRLPQHLHHKPHSLRQRLVGRVVRDLLFEDEVLNLLLAAGGGVSGSHEAAERAWGLGGDEVRVVGGGPLGEDGDGVVVRGLKVGLWGRGEGVFGLGFVLVVVVLVHVHVAV